MLLEVPSKPVLSNQIQPFVRPRSASSFVKGTKRKKEGGLHYFIFHYPSLAGRAGWISLYFPTTTTKDTIVFVFFVISLTLDYSTTKQKQLIFGIGIGIGIQFWN